MWRLVDSGLVGPAMSAAMDEAVLVARSEGRVPNTLHLYRRDRPTVSLGRFERITDSVDLEEAGRLGVAVVRRMSGGSAIYTDQGQVIYTVVIDGREVPESPQETFKLLCQGVVGALSELGVEAQFKPINDVLVNGRKISGSAQMRQGGVVAQHGTLLVLNDYRRMFSVLRRSKRDRGSMTSLSEVLEVVPPMGTIGRAMATGFSEALTVDLVPGELSAEERRTADHLVRTRYGDAQYTYRY